MLPAEFPPNLIQRLQDDDGQLVVASAAVTLRPGQNRIHVAIPAGTFLITLPPVASCPGESFEFLAISDATGTVTINDALADGLGTLATQTLGALNDWVIIKNYGGTRYRVLDSAIAP